jgi:hypothetical protein
MGKVRRKVVKLTDKRIKMVTEVVTGIKVCVVCNMCVWVWAYRCGREKYARNAAACLCLAFLSYVIGIDKS